MWLCYCCSCFVFDAFDSIVVYCLLRGLWLLVIGTTVLLICGCACWWFVGGCIALLLSSCVVCGLAGYVGLRLNAFAVAVWCGLGFFVLCCVWWLGFSFGFWIVMWVGV